MSLEEVRLRCLFGSISLREIVEWYIEAGLSVEKLTDYYNNEISLDINDYSKNSEFIRKVRRLEFLDQVKIIDMIEKSYWISLVGQQ